jgi:hypothetical protein
MISPTTTATVRAETPMPRPTRRAEFSPEDFDLVDGVSKKLRNRAGFFAVRSMTGTVWTRINGGEWCKLKATDMFSAPPDSLFESLEFKSTGGAGTLSIIYGFGSISVAGFSTNAVGDGVYSEAGPNPILAGIIPANPAAPAIYFPDIAAPGFWVWSVTNQTWIQLLA